MKKTMLVLSLILALALFAQTGLAEEFEIQRQSALDAAMQTLPEAIFDYELREFDDGEHVWELFFTQDGQVGQCEVAEGSDYVREMQMFDMPEGGLTANEAMELLIQEKGDLTILELELDWDDGRLLYEGEAQLDGRYYDFEMSVTGRIIEWERD